MAPIHVPPPDMRWMGEPVNFRAVLAHYRAQTHRRKWNGEPNDKQFYWTITRHLIREYRRQMAAQHERLAA